MADPTELLFDGLDAPRPLPPELRERLAEQLLSRAGTADTADTAPLPLGAELDERLRAALADPVAELFDGLDAPRPLPDAMRARLAGAMEAGAMEAGAVEAGGIESGGAPQRHRGGSWPAGLVGAAAAAVLVAAVAVLSLSNGGGPGSGSHTSAGADRSTATQPPGVTGGLAGGVTGGTAGGSGSGGSRPVPSSHATGGNGQASDGVTGVGAGTSNETPRGAGIASVTPNAGPLAGGTTVAIHGSGFATASGVAFGPRAATAYTVISDTTIRARTPASATAGTVDVVVAVESGASYRLSSAFTYLPRPRVDAVAPNSGSIHGGAWVTLTGAALRRTTQVQFGGTGAQRVEVVSDTQLRALSPSHLPGTVDVTVTTPGGTSATGSGDRYTYLP